jgi:transposase
MGWKTPIRIELDESERAELETMARSHAVAHGVVVRAKIILGVVAGWSLSRVAREVGCGRRIVRKWAERFCRRRMAGLFDEPRGGRSLFFPPAVAAHLVKLACDLPDNQQRSLSLWTCAELGRTLQRDKIVETISPQSVQRILASYRLKPWRSHYWLNAKGPRDEEFRRRTEEICERYTRELESYERVLSVDEKTSLQPRTRKFATRAARPDSPVKVEHE